ncbi:MAG: aromatic amino acid lyase, partial [Bacteroidota bacterium]|nr:aromatic amino acid lyase [Bacteroidota bacterium]
MEETFWLQSQNYLTVESIQNILAKKVILKYSPELHHPVHQENKGSVAENANPNELTAFSLGLGDEVPAEITRVMLLLSADYFAKNPIPDSSHIILRILELYDFEITPQVFSQGLYSSPTAHLLSPVFGSAKVYFQGYLLNAADVHDIFSWQVLSWPITLPTSLFQA